jgi:hypothetical protein
MTWQPHNTHGRACWCEPDLLQPCPECGGEGLDLDQHYTVIVDVAPRDPQCWRCSGQGVVPAFEQEEPMLVVHHA